MIGLRNGKGGGTSFACQGLFFLLDSHVIRIFRLKNRLIILRAVTYMIHGRMCFRAVTDQQRNYSLAIFLETAVGYERMCLGNKSRRPLPCSCEELGPEA